jgi:methionyl-tRNA formyltransferase
MLASLPITRPRQIIFFGTPDVAVGPLRSLVAAGLPVALVVTGEDKRRGRGSDVSPSPVKAAANELGIPVSHQVSDAIEFAKNQPETLGVVVAFGHIFNNEVLAVLPMINIHYSLLPRWRGAAPVERAILEGDRETGVSIIQVAQQLDAGNIIVQVATDISQTETLAELRSRLEALAEPLLLDVCQNGVSSSRPQEGEPIVAKKISPTDVRLSFFGSAEHACRQIRIGGAFSYIKGKRLKVLTAERVSGMTIGVGEIHLVNGQVFVGFGEDAIHLQTVQLEGKPSSEASSWFNGARINVGERFDEQHQ